MKAPILYRLIACLCLGLFWPGRLPAQVLGQTPQQRAFIRLAGKWTKESWTGNDAPYQRINAQVDAEVTASPTPSVTWRRYYDEAKTRPHDPQAQYRWIYCLFKSWACRKDDGMFQNRQAEELAALTVVPSPNTYSFSRLCYFVGGPCISVAPLGERLLKYNPKDVSVKWRLALGYTQTFSLPNAQRYFDRGIELAQQMVKEQPKNPLTWFTLATSYDPEHMADRKSKARMLRAKVRALRITAGLAAAGTQLGDFAREGIKAMEQEAAKNNIKL